MGNPEKASTADKVITVILVFIVVVLISMLIGGAFDTAGKYKQGQIDALTGKVKYELVAQPDSTRIWKSIEEGH